ncbi:MAG: class I SAM-dependent methyltransferase [Roseburia sp.]|nr:class I SAM-dependent methyltransferase [Roseburia sp.]
MEEKEKFEEYRRQNPNELTDKQFAAVLDEMEHPKAGLISDEYLDFKLWCKGMPSRQEAFADFISKWLAPDRGKKILEVGAGRTARLSRLLAAKGYQMTGMDPQLEIDSSEEDAKTNIRRIRAAFDYQTADLTEYDYVVAQEPCEATEHIVRAATEQGIPFLMVLCGVPHSLISGEMPEDVYAWYDYLQEIAGEDVSLLYLPLYGKSRTAVMVRD